MTLRPSLTLLLTCFVATSLSACKSNEAGPSTPTPGAPGKSSSPAPAPSQEARVVAGPDLSGNPPSGSQPSAEGGAALPPGHPAVDATGTAPAPAAGPSGTLRGTLTLDAARTADVKAGSTLFLIVRRDAGDGQKGMLVASKKIPVSGSDMFPMDYEITERDVMMQGTAFSGPMRVDARVDGDGDALSKLPGDVVGAHPAAVIVGAEKVDVALKDKL